MTNPIQAFRTWRQKRSMDSVLLKMLGGSAQTKSGVMVTPFTALKCGVLLACIRVLSEGGAVVPLKVFKRLDNGGKEPAVDHPLYSVLHDSPNPEMTSYEWRERTIVEMCVWGNSYHQQILDGKGNVREIWPLDPARMTVERPEAGGEKRFKFRSKSGVERIFSADEILHFQMYGDGMKGYSLVELCDEAVGLAMSAEEFAARFFANDASPRLMMQTTQALSPKSVSEMRDMWNEQHQGVAKKHKVGWLWGGMEAKLLESDISKLQLIEVRKFQIEEIARICRVSLHLIQHLDRMTNNNIEHQSISHVVQTMLPWYVRLEQRMNHSLFGPVERGRFFAEHEVDGLLRGDAVSRADYISKRVGCGTMTPDEGRIRENDNARGGAADRLYIQGAMVPLELAGKQFEKPATPIQ